MPAKLLFYTHGLVDGGGERLWSCLATALKARGHDVVFAQDFEGEENRANLDASIPLYTLGRNHFRAVRNLAALLRKEKPDVALSAIGGSNTKLLLAKWLARAPTKTIITYHGFNEWKSGLLSLITYLGLPVLSASADMTVAVSDGLREQLIARWGAQPARTMTILNPVFFPQSARVPSEAELRARPDTILAVGRFVPEKDFETLIRAFARVNRPSGPDEAKLVAEIKRLGLTDRVSLPGYSREPWAHYANAKCFALSSNSEPFGNVVVEAMAHGLPVVATACYGPQEILQHGQHGRIVAVGSDLQLAQALEAALEDPGDPQARRRRADDFSFEVRVPAYQAVIDQVLGAPAVEALADPAQPTADIVELSKHRHSRPAA
jgi:glycosyltransferase involved in cell wall biosynthesis